MTREEVVKKHKEYLFNCVTTYYKDPLVIDHAKGQYVGDVNGKQYLDFLGGIHDLSPGPAFVDIHHRRFYSGFLKQTLVDIHELTGSLKGHIIQLAVPGRNFYCSRVKLLQLFLCEHIFRHRFSVPTDCV